MKRGETSQTGSMEESTAGQRMVENMAPQDCESTWDRVRLCRYRTHAPLSLHSQDSAISTTITNMIGRNLMLG